VLHGLRLCLCLKDVTIDAISMRGIVMTKAIILRVVIVKVLTIFQYDTGVFDCKGLWSNACRTIVFLPIFPDFPHLLLFLHEYLCGHLFEPVYGFRRVQIKAGWEAFRSVDQLLEQLIVHVGKIHLIYIVGLDHLYETAEGFLNRFFYVSFRCRSVLDELI
jgi:hypothetical protein